MSDRPAKLSAKDLRKLQRALGTVIQTCLVSRRQLKPSEAEFLRPDMERLDALLGEAATKREETDG